MTITLPSTLVPVILCGGSGTRMWPLSRETYPKQFLALAGEHTMLQDTALRLQGRPASAGLSAQPIVVCNVEHRFLAASQLAAVGVHNPAIVLEPVGRNTAPALTLAALQATADSLHGADPLLLAMPADHVVTDRPALHTAVLQAQAALPHLLTDLQLLHIVLSNLLDNARRYSDPLTPITVTVSQARHEDRSGMRICVSNTPGLAGWPDAQQVFSKYYRASGAQSDSGSGLGLFLARQLVQTLRGTLSYVPTLQRVEFVLWLPLSPN